MVDNIWGKIYFYPVDYKPALTHHKALTTSKQGMQDQAS